MREELIKIAIKNNGDYFKVKRDIEKNVYYSDVEISKQYEYVTILDKNYPKQLLRLDKPPFVLFCLGDIELLETQCISVVGSRRFTLYGKVICEHVVCSKESTIVSGLAYGIDSIAHECALKEGKKTIAVIGSGFNYIYPKAHVDLANRIIEKGLLISEYPQNVEPQKRNFPMRNRIIAALSTELYVCEARKNSGTKITADMALDIGNDVFCGYSKNDYNAFSGTKELLDEGANMIRLEKKLDK